MKAEDCPEMSSYEWLMKYKKSKRENHIDYKEDQDYEDDVYECIECGRKATSLRDGRCAMCD